MAAANIWADDWQADDDWSGGGAEAKRLPRGDQLGATLYQLEPGDFAVFHFHHAQEELLVVLRGRPTLRTSEGEHELSDGDVVHFPVGPDGAHGLKNETSELVRYMMVSSLRKPEVAEYPDLKKITAFAPTGSQTGEQLWLIHDVEPDAPA
jgi:uncharacterized cupin superfamily protein